MIDHDPWLLTPGPLTTSRTVKEAMLHDFGSRDQRFIEINKQVRSRLVDIIDGRSKGYLLKQLYCNELKDQMRFYDFVVMSSSLSSPLPLSHASHSSSDSLCQVCVTLLRLERLDDLTIY